jgi:two-component system cell cycle sensor histidine kinase/response regulator CckA
VRLATSEERYRNLVEDSPALVCRFLSDSTITFVNGAFASAVDLDPSRLVGSSFLDLVRAEDRERLRERIAELGEDAPFVRYEHRMIRPDGSELWVSWAERTSVDATGAVVEIQMIGLDMTENVRARDALRRSETRFRTIVNSVNEGILVLDPDGTIYDVNDRACAMFERDHAAMVGASIGSLDRAGAPGVLEVLANVRVEGDTVKPFAWDVRGAGRHWHAEVELRGVEVDRRVRAVAVVRDVTFRIRLEEQLQQSQKMEAMGTLATGVAHDFNNVLTAIVGYAERVRAEVAPDTPAAHSIEGVLAACDQAAGVTRSLLTFGRGTPAHPTPTDLTAVARSTIDLLRPLLPDAIDVACEIPIEHRLWVRGDASQLQQVLLNLALNGRDAMPDGGRLTVALREDRGASDEPQSTRAVLQVADSGSGMSEEVRSRVMEPFFTTKPRERGTGLGMSVVHGIVTAHRGTIQIDSRPGHGTCVTVRFPSCEAPADPDRETRSRTRKAIDGARILLVEDNHQVRDLLDRALTDRGLFVTPARDGVEALERYRDTGSAFDLLVFDVDLPRMSGTACLAEIRKDGGRQPAILISGNPDIEVVTDGPDVVRFLAKPFRMDVVAALIEELL